MSSPEWQFFEIKTGSGSWEIARVYDPPDEKGYRRCIMCTEDVSKTENYIRTNQRARVGVNTEWSLLDVRDRFGMWCVAVVSAPDAKGDCKVSYEGFDRMWDTTIRFRDAMHRFALLGTYTADNCVHTADMWFSVGQMVEVLVPEQNRRTWISGMVCWVNKTQIKVRYKFEGKYREYWYPMRSTDIARGRCMIKDFTLSPDMEAGDLSCWDPEHGPLEVKTLDKDKIPVEKQVSTFNQDCFMQLAAASAI